MIQLQHISFKNWNTIGRPNKKPHTQGYNTKGENTQSKVKYNLQKIRGHIWRSGNTGIITGLR